MAKTKEILMYVGGDPKAREDKSKPRSEFDEKWDKLISGEATMEEVGTTYTKGDADKMRTAPIGEVIGFSGKTDRLRMMIVHVGYSREEMHSKEFSDYMQRTKVEMENLFGKKNLEIGFHIPDENTPPVTVRGFDRFVVPEYKECAILKRRMSKQEKAPIDIVNIMVNPKLVGRDYFGSGGVNVTNAGPVKDKDGKYGLEFKYLPEHELVHGISRVTMKHNPMDFGDGYIRDLYDDEARRMLMGAHLEFIPEDPKHPGKPIKNVTKTMKKVLEVTTPYDDNIFMVGRDGSKTKLLRVMPEEDNIMADSFSKAEKRVKAIAKGAYLYPAHHVAIDDAINDYLIGERRREAEKTVERPKLVVKNPKPKSKKLIAEIAKKKGRSV